MNHFKLRKYFDNEPGRTFTCMGEGNYEGVVFYFIAQAHYHLEYVRGLFEPFEEEIIRQLDHLHIAVVTLDNSPTEQVEAYIRETLVSFYF